MELTEHTIMPTGAARINRKQVHFEIPEVLWIEFSRRLTELGYASASEFLRQKIREAVQHDI